MLKEAVLEQLDVEQFYSDYLEGWKPGRNLKCIMADSNHEGGDDRPSMSVSKTGPVFCHSCGFKATSPIGVVEAAEGLSFTDACARVYSLGVEPIVPGKYLRDAEKALAANDYVKALLESRRGIGPETAKRYGLGWDGRLVIPVKCEAGFVVDARRHDLLGKFDVKILSYKEGYGGGRIFPLDQLKSQEVYLFEGELDTLLAIHLGLPAVTVTSGALTWDPKWNALFKGKHVIVVPDMDKPKKRPDGSTFSVGLEGAKKRIAEISKTAASVRMVCLPVSGEKDCKDFSDWICKMGGSAQALRALAKSAATRYGGDAKAEEVDETGDGDAISDEDDDLLDCFEEISKAEEIGVKRAQAVMAILEREGAFYKNSVGELWYSPNVGQPIIVHNKSTAFLSHLSRIHHLVNSASANGRFVIQHILNRAQEASKSAFSASWSMFHDDKIYLTAGEGQILRASNGKLDILRNAVNEDHVLLETPGMIAPFKPVLNVDIAKAVDLYWNCIIKHLAIGETDRFMIASWLSLAFFRDQIKAKPLIRFIASTSSGKSTASRLLSYLIYGTELLQHSSSTNAALSAMAKSYPFLPLDNLETRNMTPQLEDFLLGVATGGLKTKRAEGTDSGLVMELSSCLVLTNGIEPFARHELISRNIEIDLNCQRFGEADFNPGKVYQDIQRHRGEILSGLLALLTKHVVPRMKRGEGQRIATEFGPHAKDRFNEALGVMAMILDALWSYRPSNLHGTPHQVVAEWLDDQTSSAQKQDSGTSDILYFLTTFAERRNVLLDAHVPVEVRGNKIHITGTASALLSDFRLLARHLGIRSPWNTPRQLATRLTDAEHILKTAGWNKSSKFVNGRRVYTYVGPHRTEEHEEKGK